MDFFRNLFGRVSEPSNFNIMGDAPSKYVPRVTCKPTKSGLFNFEIKKNQDSDINPPYPGDIIPDEGPAPEVPLFGVAPPDIQEFFANLPLPPIPQWAQQQQADQGVQVAVEEEVNGEEEEGQEEEEQQAQELQPEQQEEHQDIPENDEILLILGDVVNVGEEGVEYQEIESEDEESSDDNEEAENQ